LETIKIYKEVLKLYPNNEDHKNVSNCLLNISYAYEKIGDYKNALEYTNRYLDFVELILNGKVEQATQEIETKYQLDKTANEFKEKEKSILEKQKRNQKITLLLAFLLLLSGVIFYFYYQNLLLKQKNRIKDLDSNLQYNIISATLDGQDQERNKISQILHDYVSATLSSVGLHLSAFESSLTPEQRTDLRKTRSLLKQAHDKVRDLSHELVPPLLVKFGLQFAIKDLCENNSNSLLIFQYKSTIPTDKKFDQDFEIKIYYIVSELINNIIKHSGATEAYLTLSHEDGEFSFSVIDNGKGFDVNNIRQSEGFGLTQIRARVKNMHGSITIKSKEGEGTNIIVKVKE
jgi:signal transduction histidine kinase